MSFFHSDKTIDKLKAEKVKIESRLNTLIKMTSKVYNDNASDIIDEITYQALIKEYQTEQKQLKNRLLDVSKSLEKNNEVNR